MKKGDVYADIFDSPETIKQAQRDGYSLVEKSSDKPKKEDEAKEESKAETSEKPKTARQ